MDALEEGAGWVPPNVPGAMPCSASSVADQWVGAGRRSPTSQVPTRGRLQREAHPLLGGVEHDLRLALGLRQVMVADGPPDRLAQTAQAILEQIVGRAALEHLDGRLLADAARDDDERQVGVLLAQQFERAWRTQRRHVEVGEDQVGRRAQRPEIRGLVFDPLPDRIEAGPGQLVHDQRRVRASIFEQQHPQRLSRALGLHRGTGGWLSRSQ